MFPLSPINKCLHYVGCYIKKKIENEEAVCSREPVLGVQQGSRGGQSRRRWPVTYRPWSLAVSSSLLSMAAFFETRLKWSLPLKKFWASARKCQLRAWHKFTLVSGGPEFVKINVTGEINHFPLNMNFCYCVVWEKHHLTPKKESSFRSA